MVWAVGYAFVVPLIIGAVANSQHLPAVLQVLGGQTAAAWVQAVGSVLAILAAVWLQSRARNHARDDKVEAALALCQDAKDLLEAANQLALKGQFNATTAETFVGSFETRVTILRDFDHSGYTPKLVVKVMMILSAAEQAHVICKALADGLGDRPARKTSFEYLSKSLTEVLSEAYEITGRIPDEPLMSARLGD